MGHVKSTALILVGLFVALYLPDLLRRRGGKRLPSSASPEPRPASAAHPSTAVQGAAQPQAMVRPSVAGEVWINGRKTPAVMFPFFVTRQLWLNNQAGGFDGPHTRIDLTAEALAKLLHTADATGRVEVALSPEHICSGIGIGQIDECNGYAAVDVGPHTRLIEQCTLTIARAPDGQGTHFTLEGHTGLLQPASVSPTERDAQHLAAHGTQQFHIHFRIPDEHIPMHFRDETAASAMRTYVTKSSAGNKPMRGIALTVLFALSLLQPLLPRDARAAVVEEVVAVPVKVRNANGREVAHPIQVTVFRDTERERAPFLLILHGRPTSAAEMASVRRYRYSENARYFVSLGFIVLVPTRIGYGDTGGPDVEDSGNCDARNYAPAYAAAAQESLAVLQASEQFPGMDASRGLVVGQSFGGATAIALAASHWPAIQGVVNFAGGGGGNPETRPASPCSPHRLKALFESYGQTAQVNTLWLYSENDKFWGPDLPKTWFAAFQAQGGRGSFVALPPHKDNGHGIFTGNPSAWKPAVAAFIRDLGF